MKYFTLSPGFPLRLKSSALPSFRGSAQIQHVLPWESVHTCKCTRTRMSTCIRPAKPKKKQTTEKERRNKIWDVFECVLLLHYSVLHPPSMAGNRETGATIRVLCDTLLRPFFCTTPANMQAHLSRALKPSLILWRPKHSNFFQQTSSQLALDCQWGSPNSKIYHLETHKSPLRQIFPFKASPKKKKKKESAKAQSRNV